jgi:hypothetical protein
LSLAVARYNEKHGHFPPAYQADADGRPLHSWRVLLLPYLEQVPLYKDYHFAEPWNGPHNGQLAERMPRVYAFHGDDRPGNTTTNYLAVVGPETVWPGASTISHDAIKDGSDRTILIVENRGSGIQWMEPRDLMFADMDWTLNSAKGISSKYQDPAVAMVACSVCRLRKDITPETLRALFTINGGEPIQESGAGGWEWLPDGRGREVKE